MDSKRSELIFLAIERNANEQFSCFKIQCVIWYAIFQCVMANAIYTKANGISFDFKSDWNLKLDCHLYWHSIYCWFELITLSMIEIVLWNFHLEMKFGTIFKLKLLLIVYPCGYLFNEVNCVRMAHFAVHQDTFHLRWVHKIKSFSVSVFQCLNAIAPGK